MLLVKTKLWSNKGSCRIGTNYDKMVIVGKMRIMKENRSVQMARILGKTRNCGVCQNLWIKKEL
jgi:hypothetical protein